LDPRARNRALKSWLRVRFRVLGETRRETEVQVRALKVTAETCGNGLLIRRFWVRIPGGARKRSRDIGDDVARRRRQLVQMEPVGQRQRPVFNAVDKRFE